MKKLMTAIFLFATFSSFADYSCEDIEYGDELGLSINLDEKEMKITVNSSGQSEVFDSQIVNSGSMTMAALVEELKKAQSDEDYQIPAHLADPIFTASILLSFKTQTSDSDLADLIQAIESLPFTSFEFAFTEDSVFSFVKFLEGGESSETFLIESFDSLYECKGI